MVYPIHQTKHKNGSSYSSNQTDNIDIHILKFMDSRIPSTLILKQNAPLDTKASWDAVPHSHIDSLQPPGNFLRREETSSVLDRVVSLAARLTNL